MRQTENYRQFNDNQRHALDRARNLAVRANAGSGKTRVLVERIVQQLAASWDEGQPITLLCFVAITFTRKAAGEIQDRLRAAFAELAAATRDRGERAYWQERIEELPRAMLGTIDSLCARILREFALDGPSGSRLEPDFEPLDGYEASLLRREAIDRVLNSLSAASEPPTPAEAACRWWGEQQGYDALVRHLDDLLQHQVEAGTIVAAHAGLPPAAERVEELWACLPAVRQLHQQREVLRHGLQTVIDAIDDDETRSNLEALRAGSVNLLNLIDEEHSGREADQQVLDDLRSLLFTKGERGGPRKQGLTSIIDIVKPVQDDWALLPGFAFDAEAEQVALEAADRLALLLAPVSQEYASLCRAANRYDFTALARQTRDLLAASQDVCQALQERYRFVLVDEFQDTNQLQWEIVSRVVGAGPEKPPESARLFIVGDPQQSIYRFRQADVGVFTRVQQLICAGNAALGLHEQPTLHEQAGAAVPATAEQRHGLMPLGANYRSLKPMPLELVERVCQHVFNPTVHGQHPDRHRFEVTYQQLEAGTALTAVGEVRYVIPEEPATPDDSAAEGPPAEADENETVADDLGLLQVQIVVDQLVSLHGLPKHTAKPGTPATLSWQDMAVLLPSRATVLTQLEEEFRARGVPFVVTGGIGFWQRPEVSDVVNLACCLADRGDELSLFAMLRGPLGQQHDAELLFLSQLGQGSLERGLRQVRAGDAAWVNERWQRLSPEAQAALLAYWNDLTPPRKGRLLDTARQLDHWRQRVDRMAHADLLQRALEESGAFALYAAAADGSVALANLTRCFDQVRGLEINAALDMTRLARRLRSLRDDADREEQATLARGDAVQIMTVHAAKGLEFPVVAVMKMERQAERHGGPGLLVKNAWDELLPADAGSFSGLRPGTLAVKLRHPARPREPYKPLLLKALQRLDCAQHVAESRRLFYVAATRAQEVLILAGKEPVKNKDGEARELKESWQKWFEEALGISPEHKQQGLWHDEQAGHAVRIVRKPTGAQPPVEPAAARPPARIDLAYIHEQPLHPVVATTMLEKMREQWQASPHEYWLRYRVQLVPHVPAASTVYRGGGDDAGLGSVIGTMVHRCLELPDVLESKPDELKPLLVAMAGNLIAAGADDDGEAGDDHTAQIEQAAATAQRILDKLRSNPARARPLRALVDADGQSEVAFGLRLGSWLISGRYDKLLRVPPGWEVIDWKTDGDEDAEAIVARHTPQMRLYALALWRAGLACIVEDCILVHLVLLGPVAIRTLKFKTAELETFARALEQELAAMAAAGAR